MTGLTPRESCVLQVVREYLAQNHLPPTLAEIGRKLGITRVTVRQHVQSLLAKGHLRGGKFRAARSIFPTDAVCPCCGQELERDS